MTLKPGARGRAPTTRLRNGWSDGYGTGWTLTAPRQASPARPRTTNGHHPRQFPGRTHRLSLIRRLHQLRARLRAPPTTPNGAPKRGAPPNPRSCRPHPPRRRRSANHPRWGPDPPNSSPAVAQGWPSGGAEADSAGIVGATASQSTASQWTHDPDSPARGTEVSAADLETSTSPAPGLAAPAGGESLTAAPISPGMEHLESTGDQSSTVEPAQEGTTPSASPAQEHTPVHVGVRAPTPPTPPPTTTWPNR